MALPALPCLDRAIAHRAKERPLLGTAVLCSRRAAREYTTFGFVDTANLDQGAMWSTSFALKELTATEEAKISKLLKKAVS